jgi:benzoyl-CoA 2,3-dioxygenase component B
MNEVLRDAYVEDCQRAVDRSNRALEAAELAERLLLPHRRFSRAIGIYAGHRFDPAGRLIDEAEWERKKDQWLPSAADLAYVKSLMHAVIEPGRMASFIAPPKQGIKGRPVDFVYVLPPD